MRILKEEEAGVTMEEIEPQLEAGRILIPRISEYAAIHIVQELRDVPARILSGPSDEIFATDDTRANEDDPVPFAQGQDLARVYSDDSGHPADKIPLITEGDLFGTANWKPIDTLMASALLKTSSVDAESSTEYQELIEALKREIKYKAFHRGANAVVNFQVNLTPLSDPRWQADLH